MPPKDEGREEAKGEKAGGTSGPAEGGGGGAGGAEAQSKDGQPAAPVVEAETDVVVHPLVLLSVVDHYNRVAKGTKRRAVGVLLGSRYKATVDVTNSFAVPFEEDLRNPSIWYLDHNFLESMFEMFKKVNAKERIVGFYSTGPKIRENDLSIASLFKRFVKDPYYVIVDVRPGVEGIPTTAYRTSEEVEADGKEVQRTFKHIASTIGALEAEEVGVEHLLRDINDPSVSSLANQIKHKLSALAGLKERLEEMQVYLRNVSEGKLPINNQIMYDMQNTFNLLPNLNMDQLVKGMLVKTNDMHLVVYLCALIRSIIALHDLVNNKIKYRETDDLLVMGAEAVAKQQQQHKDKDKAATKADQKDKKDDEGVEEEKQGDSAMDTEDDKSTKE